MISVDIGCVSKAKEDVPVKIAVDVGYSSVKGVSEHGRVMFPSVVAPASEDLLAGVVKSAIVCRVHLRRKMDDIEEQLVGDAALIDTLHAQCSATGDQDHHLRPGQVSWGSRNGADRRFGYLRLGYAR